MKKKILCIWVLVFLLNILFYELMTFIQITNTQKLLLHNLLPCWCTHSGLTIRILSSSWVQNLKVYWYMYVFSLCGVLCFGAVTFMNLCWFWLICHNSVIIMQDCYQLLIKNKTFRDLIQIITMQGIPSDLNSKEKRSFAHFRPSLPFCMVLRWKRMHGMIYIYIYIYVYKTHLKH